MVLFDFQEEVSSVSEKLAGDIFLGGGWILSPAILA